MLIVSQSNEPLCDCVVPIDSLAILSALWYMSTRSGPCLPCETHSGCHSGLMCCDFDCCLEGWIIQKPPRFENILAGSCILCLPIAAKGILHSETPVCAHHGFWKFWVQIRVHHLVSVATTERVALFDIRRPQTPVICWKDYPASITSIIEAPDVHSGVEMLLSPASGIHEDGEHHKSCLSSMTNT